MKTLITIIILLLFITDGSLALLHDEDMMQPSNPKHGWFGGRRSTKESLAKGEDVLDTSANMHSFTGIEGLDHQTNTRPVVHEKSGDKKIDKSKARVKDIKNVKEVTTEEEVYALENGKILAVKNRK